MRLTPQFYIISDTHFGHKLFDTLGTRPENYTDLIVERWNKVVDKNDNVLHLGDLSFVNKEKTVEICHRLKGNKFMIRGNHDGSSVSWYEDCGFRIVEPIYKVFSDKYGYRFPVLFTHEPVEKLPQGWFNIHGHIHLGEHREYKLTERHKNMCVEVIDYTPKPLYEVLNECKRLL